MVTTGCCRLAPMGAAEGPVTVGLPPGEASGG